MKHKVLFFPIGFIFVSMATGCFSVVHGTGACDRYSEVKHLANNHSSGLFATEGRILVLNQRRACREEWENLPWFEKAVSLAWLEAEEMFRLWNTTAPQEGPSWDAALNLRTLKDNNTLPPGLERFVLAAAERATGDTIEDREASRHEILVRYSYLRIVENYQNNQPGGWGSL
jgi:hypothetical protein